MLRYAIVDATCTPTHAARLAAAHVDYIQLRAKSLPTGQLATLARNLLAALATTPTKLLINTRADVALATRAHGVHLPSDPHQLTPTQIRHLYQTASTPGAPFTTQPYRVVGGVDEPVPPPNPDPPITSLSAHTLEDIARATTLAPDLILFGPIFEKRVAGELIQPGIGLTALEAAVRAAHGIPVLALGGITASNTQSCLDAGAAGIAAIRLFA